MQQLVDPEFDGRPDCLDLLADVTEGVLVGRSNREMTRGGGGDRQKKRERQEAGQEGQQGRRDVLHFVGGEAAAAGGV